MQLHHFMRAVIARLVHTSCTEHLCHSAASRQLLTFQLGCNGCYESVSALSTIVTHSGFGICSVLHSIMAPRKSAEHRIDRNQVKQARLGGTWRI